MCVCVCVCVCVCLESMSAYSTATALDDGQVVAEVHLRDIAFSVSSVPVEEEFMFPGGTQQQFQHRRGNASGDGGSGADHSSGSQSQHHKAHPSGIILYF